MSKRKKRTYVKKGLAITATFGMLMSNVGLAVPSTITYAEGPAFQVNSVTAGLTSTQLASKKQQPDPIEKAPFTDETGKEDSLSAESSTDQIELNSPAPDEETEPPVPTSDETVINEGKPTNGADQESSSTTEGANNVIGEEGSVPTVDNDQTVHTERTEETTEEKEIDDISTETVDPEGTAEALTNSPELNFKELPHVLITELAPNSAGGGTDYYEYFELYNNTDQPLVTTSYQFIYRYTKLVKKVFSKCQRRRLHHRKRGGLV